MAEHLSKDMRELLDALNRANAQYLAIGAHAVGVYTEPRGTKDLDIWINPTRANAKRVYAALREFGAPLLGTTEKTSSRRSSPSGAHKTSWTPPGSRRPSISNASS